MPTPALVAPIEFTLPRALYEQLGGHMADVVSVEEVVAAIGGGARREPWPESNPWPFAAREPSR